MLSTDLSRIKRMISSTLYSKSSKRTTKYFWKHQSLLQMDLHQIKQLKQLQQKITIIFWEINLIWMTNSIKNWNLLGRRLQMEILYWLKIKKIMNRRQYHLLVKKMVLVLHQKKNNAERILCHLMHTWMLTTSLVILAPKTVPANQKKRKSMIKL